jgi:hypothetical protein
VAIYPAAVRKLIAPGSNDPRITPRVVILHVAVSNDDSLYDFFAHHSGGIESHFYVRDSGVVEQYRDTGWQADANYHANDFAISIETEGMGAGEWTPAQLASIKALLAWCHSTHGIPLVPCARWDGTGVGYHSQFPQWSPVAKTCPGPERIAQYHNVLIPWMGDDQEEDDMPEPKDLWNADVIPVPKGRLSEANREKNPTFQADNALSEAWAYARRAALAAEASQKAVEAMAAAIDKLAPGVKAAVAKAVEDSINANLRIEISNEETP